MITVIEKVVFLQDVDIFLEVPTEQLVYLAAIAKEIEFFKGADIYKVDEPSDAMYLVLEGKVQLHRDGKEVTVAGEKDVFGTWALFDEELRIVTATTIEDTKLLRIDREDFYDLLADNIQITQGILKTLVKRIRNLLEHVSL